MKPKLRLKKRPRLRFKIKDEPSAKPPIPMSYQRAMQILLAAALPRLPHTMLEAQRPTERPSKKELKSAVIIGWRNAFFCVPNESDLEEMRL
jgi:hypothetical protein